MRPQCRHPSVPVLRPGADRSSFFDASQHRSGVGGKGWCARDREAKKVWPKKNNPGLTETRTRIVGFKVQSANHYTIRPGRSRDISPKLCYLIARVLHTQRARRSAARSQSWPELEQEQELELELGPEPSAEPESQSWSWGRSPRPSRRAGEPESRRAGERRAGG